MKILWLVNIVMPELAVHLGRTPSVFGGWLPGAMEAVKHSGHELVVCTIERKKTYVGRYVIDGVVYYLTECADMENMSKEFQNILQQEQPDVIHVYGTEFEHSCAMVRASDPQKTIVTIQGFIKYCYDAVYAGIPQRICKDRITHVLMRQLHKGGNSLELQKKRFEVRLKTENDILNEVKKQGADKVIAVKFDAEKIDEESNFMDVAMKTIDIMGNKISEENLEMSDLILNVYTDKCGLFDIDKMDKCYEYGYLCVKENIEKIRSLFK